MILDEHLVLTRPSAVFAPKSSEIETIFHVPAEIWVAGPVAFLPALKFGFFSSSQCPGSIVLKAFAAVTKMRDEGQVLMGGFHSVMECECFRILLRGRQPVIWVPARSIMGMRLKPGLQPTFKDGRLLVLSPFAPTAANARVTAALAEQRNRFIGALADRIFVPHAAPGSRTLALSRNSQTVERRSSASTTHSTIDYRDYPMLWRYDLRFSKANLSAAS